MVGAEEQKSPTFISVELQVVRSKLSPEKCEYFVKDREKEEDLHATSAESPRVRPFLSRTIVATITKTPRLTTQRRVTFCLVGILRGPDFVSSAESIEISFAYRFWE